MRKLIIYGIILFQIVLISSLIRNIQLATKARYRVRDLQERKEQLLSEQGSLKNELSYVKSDYYVEKVAREELQLGKPGESVVIVPEGAVTAPEEQQQAEEEQLPNYLKWWKVITGNE